MLRIDKTTGIFVRLSDSSTVDAGLLERYDIQKMVRQSSVDFFKELGEDLLLIGEEVQPTDFVKDRIDLLAVDSEGAAVVIELKRDTDKLQLLQAIGYAGMVADWQRDRLIQEFAKFSKKTVDDAVEDLEEFLDEGLGKLNQSQRIILLADQFPYEILVGAKWLREKDIRCYRFVMAGEEQQIFLTCPRVYPPLELTETATKPAASAVTKGFADWTTALKEGVVNPAVRTFFEAEIASGRENHLGSGYLYYRISGRRIFSVVLRKKYEYVWQEGRFEGDVFWTAKLGADAKIRQVNHERSLRFLLSTAQQFESFRKAVTDELSGKEFVASSDELPPEKPE